MWREQSCMGSTATQRWPKLSPVNTTAFAHEPDNRKRISSATGKASKVLKQSFELQPVSRMACFQSNMPTTTRYWTFWGLSTRPCRTPSVLGHMSLKEDAPKIWPNCFPENVCMIDTKCSETPCRNSACHEAFQSTRPNAFDKSSLIIQMGCFVESVSSTTLIKGSAKRRNDLNQCCYRLIVSSKSILPNINKKHIWNNLLQLAIGLKSVVFTFCSVTWWKVSCAKNIGDRHAAGCSWNCSTVVSVSYQYHCNCHAHFHSRYYYHGITFTNAIGITMTSIIIVLYWKNSLPALESSFFFRFFSSLSTKMNERRRPNPEKNTYSAVKCTRLEQW